MRAWIEDIEATWLGVTAPPWDVRARDAGWWPDASAQYCPRCGTSVGEFEADGEGCPACRGLVVPWARFVRLGAYEGVLRDAVHEIKYTAWRRLGHDLGAILGRQTQEVLSREGLGSARVVLVPVPTNPLRRLVRGIDHTLTLCRGMSRATGWTIQPVLRRRWGPSQVRVMPSKRRANVSGTMWRSGPELAADVVVLVDDVRTTGATLMEAARALGGGGGGSGGGGTGGGGGAAMMWAAALCVAGAGPGGRTKLVFDRVEK